MCSPEGPNSSPPLDSNRAGIHSPSLRPGQELVPAACGQSLIKSRQPLVNERSHREGERAMGSGGRGERVEDGSERNERGDELLRR